MFSAFLGFRRIFLAGVDCNYVECVAGAVEGDARNKLVIANQPASNPNYFFDSYQQPGDEYNLPNPSKDLHVRSWRNCAARLQAEQPRLGTVRVVNINENSKVDCFENSTSDAALLDVGMAAIHLARGFAREFGSDGSRTGMIHEITELFAGAIRGTRPVGRSALKHEIRNPGLSHSSEREGSFTLKLDKPVVVPDNHLFCATFGFSSRADLNLSIRLLGGISWQQNHHTDVEIRRKSDCLPQSDGPGLYVIKTGEDHYILLVNITATKGGLLEGLEIEATADHDSLVEVANAFRVVSFALFSPMAVDEGSRAAPAHEGGAAIFSEALGMMKAGNYKAARGLAARLSKDYPDSQPYAEMVNVCDRFLGNR
jgi:hypothetical protein